MTGAEFSARIRRESLTVIVPEPSLPFLEQLFSVLDHDRARVVTISESIPSWAEQYHVQLFRTQSLDTRESKKLVLFCGDMVWKSR